MLSKSYDATAVGWENVEERWGGMKGGGIPPEDEEGTPPLMGEDVDDDDDDDAVDDEYGDPTPPVFPDVIGDDGADGEAVGDDGEADDLCSNAWSIIWDFLGM